MKRISGKLYPRSVKGKILAAFLLAFAAFAVVRLANALPITPGGLGVRVDSHLYNGYTVPPYYDSMIAKVITHAATREEALARMRMALDELVVGGIRTNIPMQQDLVRDAAFAKGGVNIHYLEKKLTL